MACVLRPCPVQPLVVPLTRTHHCYWRPGTSAFSYPSWNPTGETSFEEYPLQPKGQTGPGFGVCEGGEMKGEGKPRFPQTQPQVPLAGSPAHPGWAQPPWKGSQQGNLQAHSREVENGREEE